MSFEVTICRVGYSFATITVEGVSSQAEAEAKALESAGNYDYSEKSSEYEVSGTMEIE